jgi:hypothetical protein
LSLISQEDVTMGTNILGLILLVVLAACSGDKEGGTDTAAEIFIHTPANDMITTSYADIKLSGNASMSNAANYPNGSVHWYNNSNGTAGVASSSVFCLIACLMTWEAHVPLAIGSNLISVNYIDAADSITVTRTASISGRIISEGSLGAARIVVHAVPGSSRTSADGSGYYSIGALVAGSYSITPQSPAPPNSGDCMTFTPPSRNITMDGTANVTGQDFIAAQLSPCYSVSGRVTSGADAAYGYEGVHIVTTDARGATGPYTYTDSGGYYVLYPLASGTYTAIPDDCFWGGCTTFSPPSRTFTVDQADVTGQNFTR